MQDCSQDFYNTALGAEVDWLHTHTEKKGCHKICLPGLVTGLILLNVKALNTLSDILLAPLTQNNDLELSHTFKSSQHTNRNGNLNQTLSNQFHLGNKSMMACGPLHHY